MQVLVRDNNVDQAPRVLKKKMQREGVFREMKRRFSEKPSEKATREKAAAARRARKRAERDRVITAPRKRQAQIHKAAAIQARAVA